ncbi:alpha/beta fold hydrolase [Natrononativus amylolyticus]|nr:alpha/beta hydrolase [Natrononativus amylolyticus]
MSVEYFESSGHCPTLEEPERFNRVMAEFVAALWRVRGVYTGGRQITST